MDRGLVKFTLRGRHWVAEMVGEIWGVLEMTGGGELMAKLSRFGCAHLLGMECSSRCFGDTARPPDESASYLTAAQRTALQTTSLPLQLLPTQRSAEHHLPAPYSRIDHAMSLKDLSVRNLPIQRSCEYDTRSLVSPRSAHEYITTNKTIEGAFVFLTLAAAYLGLSALQIPQVNEKILHFITFFLLTIAFYFILDTTRRRVLNLTLLVVTFSLGLGSELAQGILTGRTFDPINIAANVAGSLAALGLCLLYHKRMLERKRRRKGYGVVPQDGEEDLELAGQEVGVVEAHEDNEAWDDMGGEESGEGEGEGRITPSSGGVGDEGGEAKKSNN